LEDIKENGLSAHAKYGSWLLTEEGGMEVVTSTLNSEKGCYIGHLDGRRYVSPDKMEEHKQERMERTKQQQEQGKSNKTKKQQRRQEARAQEAQEQEAAVEAKVDGASLVLWGGGLAVVAALLAIFLVRRR
jgi:hypothetical protein